MCYVHVAALVAEFLHRKSKCVLFGRHKEDDALLGFGGDQNILREKFLLIW